MTKIKRDAEPRIKALLRFVACYLALLLLSCEMIEGQAPTSLWIVQTIQTRDSVGLDETTPMIRQFRPPAVYARWLFEIVQCEGLPFPTPEQIAGVTFWEVNAPDFQTNGDPSHTAVATADPPAGRMYLTITSIWNEEVVKHEFVHFLLRWRFGAAYKGGHPVEYYARCGLHPF